MEQRGRDKEMEREGGAIGRGHPLGEGNGALLLSFPSWPELGREGRC